MAYHYDDGNGERQTHQPTGTNNRVDQRRSGGRSNHPEPTPTPDPILGKWLLTTTIINNDFANPRHYSEDNGRVLVFGNEIQEFDLFRNRMRCQRSYEHQRQDSELVLFDSEDGTCNSGEYDIRVLSDMNLELKTMAGVPKIYTYRRISDERFRRILSNNGM